MAKRLLVALICFGAVVFGQSLSGSWSTRISLLPPPAALDYTRFDLQGKLFDWTVGGTAEFFGTDGWVWQTLFAKGALGPISSEWMLLFGPLAPAFLYAYGKYTVPIGGIDVVLHTAMVGPNGPYVFTGGPSGGAVLELEQSLNGFPLSLEIGLGARKQDFTIQYTGVGTYTKVFPIDPFPGGLEFTYLKLGLRSLPLCCGISLDLDFSFTKEAGFDTLVVTLKEMPLCCGISLDTEVEFTTTAKTVNLRPKWAGITGCFTVYGNARLSNNTWQGIELYGVKLRCDLGDCAYAEFLTALDPDKVEEILGEDIFAGAEFEYLKLKFCGAGCCGGTWTFEAGLFFQPSGSLFGLSRVLMDVVIPVMANLEVNAGLVAPVGGPAGLSVGWTFTF